MGQTEATEGLDERLYDLSFSIHKSRRYHDKLHSFYLKWCDITKIGTVVTGSSAFLSAFTGYEWAATVFSGIVALWAIIDIIVGPEKLASLHKDLATRFTDLAVELETVTRTEDSLSSLKAKRLRIERDEPPCKRLVDLQARNEECRARGFPISYLVPLSGPQRWIGYFIEFGTGHLDKWQPASKDQQKAA